MSESGKQALLLIAITVCLVLVVQPNCLSALVKRPEAPRRVLSEAEMQLFTTTANSGEIVMVGASGVLIDQGSQALRVGTSHITAITNNAERIRIDNSGNVGIGTTNAAATLHVYGSTFIENTTGRLDIRATTGSGSTGTDSLGEVRFLDNQGRMDCGAKISAFGDYNGAGWVYGGKLCFYTTAGNGGTSAERMRISEFGSVGIGTTSPQGRLHIQNTGGTDFLTLWNSTKSYGQHMNLRFAFGDSTTNKNAYIQIYQYSDDDASIKFFTQGASASSVNPMVIRGNGNVGVGTDDPGATLHVGGTGAKFIGYSGPMYSTDAFIGQTLPNWLFEISPLGNSWNGDGNKICQASSIRLKAEPLKWASGAINLPGAEVVIEGGKSNRGQQTGGSIIFNTWDAERMRITPFGNVGIGTTDPQCKFQVMGFGNGNAVDYWIAGAFGAASDSTAPRVVLGSYSNIAVVGSHTSNLSAWAPLSINPDGSKVSIGTISPLDRQSLTVQTNLDIMDLGFGVAQGINGTADTFYPVVIGVSNTSNTMPSFTITRGNVNENGNGWGTLALSVEFCGGRWGHNTPYYSYRFTNGQRFFVARIRVSTFEQGVVVWLRGSTTYHFRGIGCYLQDNNFWANSLTLTNNEVFSALSAVDDAFNFWFGSGDTRSSMFSIGSDLGIGTAFPRAKLELTGAYDQTHIRISDGAHDGSASTFMYPALSYFARKDGVSRNATALSDQYGATASIVFTDRPGTSSYPGNVRNSDILFYTSNNINDAQTLYGAYPRERMRIGANGKVGIGIVAPDSTLQVVGDFSIGSKTTINSAGPGLNIANDGITTTFTTRGGWPYGFSWRSASAYDTPTTTERMSLTGFGQLWIQGALTQNSDASLKKNISSLENSLPILLQLSPKSYHFLEQNDDDSIHFGLIAQEVKQIFPNIVSTTADGKLALNYIELIPILIQSVKEQSQIIQDLSSRLSRVESLLAQLVR